MIRQPSTSNATIRTSCGILRKSESSQNRQVKWYIQPESTMLQLQRYSKPRIQKLDIPKLDTLASIKLNSDKLLQNCNTRLRQDTGTRIGK